MAEPHRTPHPGRTPEERQVLDAIGHGDLTTPMAPEVRDALLKAGLIVEAGTEVRRDSHGERRVPAYDMPLLIHADWSNAVLLTDPQRTAIETMVSGAFDRMDEFNKRFDDV